MFSFFAKFAYKTSDMNDKERIIELREQLHTHNYNYYVLNRPAVSDREFDHLMHELEALEQQHPEMYDANSPTQRVGSDLTPEVPPKFFKEHCNFCAMKKHCAGCSRCGKCTR